MHILNIILLISLITAFSNCQPEKVTFYQQTVEVLRDSVLLLAEENIKKVPITVTASSCSRSAGGIHDFYSEGDYWWPDTLNPDGPYIRKDGMTNPDNFTNHRKAMVRFSEIVGNLTSAFIITKDTAYANAVIRHCRAWFIDDSTKMNPHLLYAQAIKGRHTGRGIGIIDAIHLMEVVQSLTVLEMHDLVSSSDVKSFKKWFADFLSWLTTHPYGKDEMVHPNNHGTCWNMQVGVYAQFTENDSILDFCRDNFQHTILPSQMARDGSFPLEMERTKPYGYSLFNLDAITMNCVVLSDKSQDMWTYQTSDGKSILKGIEFMHPYVAEKSTWPQEPDVMYWNNWPVAHPAFLFGAIIFSRDDFFDAWKRHKHFLEVEEVRRNMPIRNPLIWISEDGSIL